MSTAKQQKEHTGTRNGDLFCFNCGDSHKMNLPLPVDEAADIMIAFGKRHKKCQKTWVEPSYTEAENMSFREKCNWWLTKGERGISSETMYSVLTGNYIREPQTFSHPCDPDDFRRCYLLLKAIPELNSSLPKMKIISHQWTALVDNWDKLTEMLEEQLQTKKPNGMYELMQKLGC